MEDLNLSFTLVTDNGLKNLSGLASLKSLSLDAPQITDYGLLSLIGKGETILFCILQVKIDLNIGTNSRYEARCLLEWLLPTAGLAGVTHLDLFGAHITDSGTNFLLCKLILFAYDHYHGMCRFLAYAFFIYFHLN